MGKTVAVVIILLALLLGLASPLAVASADNDRLCTVAERLSYVLAKGVSVAKEHGGNVSVAEQHLARARELIEKRMCGEAVEEARAGLAALKDMLPPADEGGEGVSGRAEAVEKFLEKSRLPEDVKRRVREALAEDGDEVPAKLKRIIQERQRGLLLEKLREHLARKIGVDPAEAQSLAALLESLGAVRGAVSVLKGLHGLSVAYANIAEDVPAALQSRKELMEIWRLLSEAKSLVKSVRAEYRAAFYEILSLLEKAYKLLYTAVVASYYGDDVSQTLSELRDTVKAAMEKIEQMRSERGKELSKLELRVLELMETVAKKMLAAADSVFPGDGRFTLFGVIAWIPDNETLIVVGADRRIIIQELAARNVSSEVYPPPLPAPPTPPKLPMLRVYKVDISNAKVFGEPAVGAPVLVIGRYAGIDPELKIPIIRAEVVYVKVFVI